MKTQQKNPSVKGYTINGRELKKAFEYLYDLQNRAHEEMKENKKYKPALSECITLEKVLFYMIDIREPFHKYKVERRKIEAENQ